MMIKEKLKEIAEEEARMVEIDRKIGKEIKLQKRKEQKES